MSKNEVLQPKKLKTPISYYGGKQKLANRLIEMFPEHVLYCEPFVGGGAVFWLKEPSAVEVINDTNRELINFYEVCKNQFVDLEKKIRITIHSRSLFNDAKVIYENPHMFSQIDRALAAQGFASMLDGTWGYDKIKNTTSMKISNKRESFTEELSIRLQLVQIECTDALRIIRSRDGRDAFFYCDPPYFNSDCAHYDGYSREDFEQLLKALESIEGKFMLSSYPSDILSEYTAKNRWVTKSFQQQVTVANNTGKRKPKTEVVTMNYTV